MTDYKFYMQGVTQDGEIIQGTQKDLEKDFKGLRYKQIEGLNKYGKPTNVYTEKYSESESLKVYIPSVIVYDATSIVLTLLFVGDERQDTLREFNEYIYNGIHSYWDTLRGLEFSFICKEASEPDEDELKGVPYISVKYKLQNIKGKTEKRNQL